MNCFYHHDRSAVGICKNCQRGLCPDCAAEVTDGLACKGRCEGRVLLIGRLIEANERDTERAKQAVRRTAASYIGSGLAIGACAALGQLLLLRLDDLQAAVPWLNYMLLPLWILAAVSVLAGIWFLMSARPSSPAAGAGASPEDTGPGRQVR